MKIRNKLRRIMEYVYKYINKQCIRNKGHGNLFPIRSFDQDKRAS